MHLYALLLVVVAAASVLLFDSRVSHCIANAPERRATDCHLQRTTLTLCHSLCVCVVTREFGSAFSRGCTRTVTAAACENVFNANNMFSAELRFRIRTLSNERNLLCRTRTPYLAAKNMVRRRFRRRRRPSSVSLRARG